MLSSFVHARGSGKEELDGHHDTRGRETCTLGPKGRRDKSTHDLLPTRIQSKIKIKGEVETHAFSVPVLRVGPSVSRTSTKTIVD